MLNLKSSAKSAEASDDSAFSVSDDPTFSVSAASIYASFIPSAANVDGHLVFANGGTAGSSSVAGSVVAVSSGGININLLFDSAAMAAPASFRAGITQAASILASTISDKITVNLNIDYSGTGGGAAAGPDNGQFVSYSTVRSDLVSHATAGDTTFNALPSGFSVQGQSNVAVWNAQLKLFGIMSANDGTTDDGSAYFATDINPGLLVGVALHELTHALGRIPYGPQPDVFDLYRFTSPGVRLFQGTATAPAAYFSVDGGATKLADFGRTSDSSDFLNSGVQGSNDPFNEFYTGSTNQTPSLVDQEILDALGFHLTSNATVVIESLGFTSLVQVANGFFLNPVGGGTGPALKFGGSPVTAAQLGIWAPIAVEAVSGGYEVAFKIASTDQYAVWSTDSNGNYTGNLIGTVSGSSAALEALEPSFQQDLNGDGVIGVPTTVIEALGSTSLVAVGGNFYLDNISSGTGPVLKFGGSPVTAGQLGVWAPLGVEAISGGYDVAFKIASTDQYTVWSTDSNGNYTGNLIGTVSGSSAALEALEPSFHQDMNGDGVIGVPSAAVAFTSFQSVGGESATFDGTTLDLKTPSTFTGRIIGFAGVGSAAGSDQIDLRGMNSNSIHLSFDASTGSLAVSDGTTTASLQFLGHYSSDSFHFADDGHGGTLILGAGVLAAADNQASTLAAGGHDTFVFAANFGQITLVNFAPTTDSIEFNHTVFAGIAAVLAAARDDQAGNAVITDAAHDTITLQHITSAQLAAHQTAFHFV